MGYFYQSGLSYYNSSGSTTTGYVPINVSRYGNAASYYNATYGVYYDSSVATGYYYLNGSSYINVKRANLSSYSPTIVSTSSGVKITQDASSYIKACTSNASTYSLQSITSCSSSVRDIVPGSSTVSISTSSTIYVRYFIPRDSDNYSYYFSNYSSATKCSGQCGNAGTGCGTCASGSTKCVANTCLKEMGGSLCISGDSYIKLYNNEYKKIKDLNMDDILLGYDRNTNSFIRTKILQKFISNKAHTIYKVILENKKNILLITNKHDLLTDKGYKPVEKIETSDMLLLEDKNFYKIKAIKEYINIGTVYNILTDSGNYIANGIVIACEDMDVFNIAPNPEKVYISDKGAVCCNASSNGVICLNNSVK